MRLIRLRIERFFSGSVRRWLVNKEINSALAACRREIFCTQINADKLRFLVLGRLCLNFKTILRPNLSLSEQSEYKYPLFRVLPGRLLAKR